MRAEKERKKIKMYEKKIMDELDYCKLMLQNHIDGLLIAKTTDCWNDEDDERTLDLMERLMRILERIKIDVV